MKVLYGIQTLSATSAIELISRKDSFVGTVIELLLL